MRFNKYSVSSGKNKSTIVSSSSGGYGSNVSNTNGSSTLNVNRILWGQQDTGNDIEDNMLIQGNSYIVNYDISETDNDLDSADELPQTEDVFEKYEDIFGKDNKGGNLYVKNKLKVDGDIESPEIYASKTLYVPHPDTKIKTDIIELLKGYDQRITTNATNITNLQGRMSTAETNISNCQSHCQQNSTDINTLKQLIEQLQLQGDNQYGSINRPIVLMSGRLQRNSWSTSSYSFNGARNDKILNIACSISNGMLTITLTPFSGAQIAVQSIHCTQGYSGKTEDISNNRLHEYENNGSYWFEARADNNTNTSKIYVREFHQTNNHNDGWSSDDWTDANSGPKMVNITVYGYITFS